MLAAAVVLLALGAAAAPPLNPDFPHIPWLAVQVSAVPATSQGLDDDCRSASATFLLLLLQGKHHQATANAIVNDLSGGREGCSSRLGLSTEEKRWPRTLVTVQCSCEGRRCHLLGAFHCSTLLGSVSVLRRGIGGAMVAATEVLPVGCRCLERPSKRAQHVSPQVTQKKSS